jgi:hypothetical protein
LVRALAPPGRTALLLIALAIVVVLLIACGVPVTLL